MYSIDTTLPYSSNSSSPPSSPNLYIDSSPASSPAPDSPYIQINDDIPPIHLAHPFAASAKSNWRPPQYEKKRPISPMALPSASAKKARHDEQVCPNMWDAQSSPVDDSFFSLSAAEERTYGDMEVETWEEASAQVVDNGSGVVMLEGKNLTHIPESFINDLASIYIIPDNSYFPSPNPQPPPSSRILTRVATAPAGTDTWPRFLNRTHSMAAVPLGLPRDRLQLFLSSNSISNLPLSVFNLGNLSVLSLRKNNLTHIPPEIVRLAGLKDLNIAGNRIKYLPSEMLQMKLTLLHVYPNPFVQPPPSTECHSLGTSTIGQDNISPDTVKRRPVSDTMHTIPSRIPPLVELSFRSLLSPFNATTSKSVLETCYDFPLAECPADPSYMISSKKHFAHPLPSHIRHVLDVCIPGSVYLDDDNLAASTVAHDTSKTTGIGLCQSPKHLETGTPNVFVRHAEERFTWETTVADCFVGGLLPLLWRGCSRGCLGFLDPPKANFSVMDAITTHTSTEIISTASDHEDIEEVVQVIHLDALESTEMGDDDFAD